MSSSTTFRWWAGSFLACLALFAFASSRSISLSLALLVAIGLGTSAFGTMQSTIVLSRVAEAMRGRAVGIIALAIGTAPLGSLEISGLVDRLGAPLAVAVNAALCAALVAWASGRAGLFGSAGRTAFGRSQAG